MGARCASMSRTRESAGEPVSGGQSRLLQPVPAVDRAVAIAWETPEEAATSSTAGLTPPTRRRGGSRFLSDVIVELGFVEGERVEAAARDGRATGRTAEQILVEGKALSSDQLARATAERFGLDHVDLGSFKIDVGAANLVSPHAARRYNAAPIGFDPSGGLLVAMTEPANVLALDDLKLITGHEIRPVVASSDDLAAYIGRMSRFDEAVAEAIDEEGEDAADPVTEIRESATEAPVIKLVNSILAQAVQDGASDVHFEPGPRDMRVRFRVDGVLSESTTIPRRMIPGVVSRVKIMSELDIAERRLPQDGRVTLSVEGTAVDIRVVTLPAVLGEGIVMRLLNKEQVLLDVQTLGMVGEGGRRFEASFRQSFGAVLVTGPTGSGKSTTLYAALNEINSVDRKILTIEDPVEYQLPGINQIQVNPRSGLSFARALRSMLRADPDVIMVGEIRDGETARIAVESALTGHLVLSTLHTNDAPSAITRLTEMGVEPFLTASALDCVVAQRLARTLCTYCKRPARMDATALAAAGFAGRDEFDGYEPVGCSRCGGTGYRGRTGLYEVMVVSERIRALTVERSAADVIAAVAVEEGMRPLREDAIEKVGLGVTSLAEVARVT